MCVTIEGLKGIQPLFHICHLSFVISNVIFQMKYQCTVCSPLASISFIILSIGMKACDTAVIYAFVSSFSLMHNFLMNIDLWFTDFKFGQNELFDIFFTLRMFLRWMLLLFIF